MRYMICALILATLPLLLFLLEWYFFQDRSLTWLKKRLGWILTGIALLVGVIFLFLGPSPLEAILADYGGRDFTMTERLFTESRVVLYYLGLFLLPLPSRLNLDHDVTVLTRHGQPSARSAWRGSGGYASVRQSCGCGATTSAR